MKLTRYQERVVAVLTKARRPLDYQEISERAFVAVSTLVRMMRQLRELGLVRVAKWDRNLRTSGAYTPLFSLARGKKDEPKPKAIPVTERTRAWKKRNRYAQERYIKQGIPAFGRRVPRNPTAVIDPLVGAVMGEKQ